MVSSLTARPAMTATLGPATTSVRPAPVPARPAESEPQERRLSPDRPTPVVEAEVIDPGLRCTRSPDDIRESARQRQSPPHPPLSQTSVSPLCLSALDAASLHPGYVVPLSPR